MFDNISKTIEKIKDIDEWNPVKKVSEKINNLLDIGKDTKAVQDVKKQIGGTEAASAMTRSNHKLRNIPRKKRMTF